MSLTEEEEYLEKSYVNCLEKIDKKREVEKNDLHDNIRILSKYDYLGYSTRADYNKLLAADLAKRQQMMIEYEKCIDWLKRDISKE